LKKVFPSIAVTIASSMAAGILAVASLSFLGVGAQPPTPTWGNMLSSEINYLNVNGYSAIFPGLMIVLTVGALGLVADGTRDATGALAPLDAVNATGLADRARSGEAQSDVARVA
jgi:peptide/nickel transport system permease protein